MRYVVVTKRGEKLKFTACTVNSHDGKVEFVNSSNEVVMVLNLENIEMFYADESVASF